MSCLNNELAEFRNNPSVEDMLIFNYEVKPDDEVEDVKQEEADFEETYMEEDEESENSAEDNNNGICFAQNLLNLGSKPMTDEVPNPAIDLCMLIPLSLSLQSCVKSGTVDMWSAASMIRKCALEGVAVAEQVKLFATHVAASADFPSMPFGNELYDPANIHHFQCATILSHEVYWARMKATEKLVKSRESNNTTAPLIVSSLVFDVANFSKRHAIPASLDPNFRQGEIDFGNMILTNSKRVLNRLRNFLVMVLTKLCDPPSAIQQYHYRTLKFTNGEEEGSQTTKQLPSEIVNFIQELMLDTVSLLHELVASMFPPTPEEKKTPYFLSLGANDAQRMKALQVARHNRHILMTNFIPSKISEALREMRHSSFVEVDGRTRLIRRSHKSAAQKRAEEAMRENR